MVVKKFSRVELVNRIKERAGLRYESGCYGYFSKNQLKDLLLFIDKVVNDLEQLQAEVEESKKE